MPLKKTTSYLTSSELAVLDCLPETPCAVSQRKIAKHTGFSVGLINAVIKKLVRTGLVKTSRLNSRSIEYLLTPQGFAEKTTKSYHYILNTVRNYRELQLQSHKLLSRLCRLGFSEFYLHGESELTELITLFFEMHQYGALHKGLPEKGSANTVVLNVSPHPVKAEGCVVVDMTSELCNGQKKFYPYG